MIPKAASTLLLTLLLMQLTSVLSGGKYPMSQGRSVIIKGERKPCPGPNGEPPDILLYKAMPAQKKIALKGKGKEFCYPPQGSTDQVKITQFEVLNQDVGLNGGLAFEVSGGVGMGQVCVYLKSRRQASYKFLINVHGYRLSTSEKPAKKKKKNKPEDGKKESEEKKDVKPEDKNTPPKQEAPKEQPKPTGNKPGVSISINIPHPSKRR